MSREDNVRIFNETREEYDSDVELYKSIQNSIRSQHIYWERDAVPAVESRNLDARVIVEPKRTFEAAEPFARAGKKVMVLNFASATHPGGGVLKGASAQEEALCRCSTLYPCLTASNAASWYVAHKNMSVLHNDDIIYTPDVTVFRTDTMEPKTMGIRKWYKVDVMTCAAPNLRDVPNNGWCNNGESNKAEKVSDKELLDLHRKRAGRMLAVADYMGAEVLILGAFGCGAFRNPPSVVAEAYKDVLEEFKGHFDTVDFAIYCSKYDTDNYNIFRDMLC